MRYVSAMNLLGPLAQLAGEWEGDQGLDVSYHNVEGEVAETPYREHISFKPFGPVDNGSQHLYGLDYRMAAWRVDEENPFHTEVGYWLWDADLGHVMRAFVIPRASVLMAGGDATPESTSFTLRATAGDDGYGILSNPYLLEAAKCVSYEVTIDIGSDEFSYSEDSVLEMVKLPEPLHHTDRNVLQLVERYELEV